MSPFLLRTNRTLWRRCSTHLPLREDPKRAYLSIHASAQKARTKLGDQLFFNLTRIAVVRNPYDLQVSYYHFLRLHKANRHYEHAISMTFEQFVDFSLRSRTRLDQLHLLESGKTGEMLINRLLYFEDLKEGFDRMALDLGLPVTKLPVKNTTVRSGYREYYNSDTIEKTQQIYRVDFDRFGYDFDTGLARNAL